MTFDWNDYLTIAKKLKGSTDGKPHTNNIEALQRSAVSRAYYSVYHLATSYAKSHFADYAPKQDGANNYHTSVRLAFQSQRGNPDHQEVAKLLFQLHKARKGCDYEEDGIGNVEALLGSTIIQADKVKTILAK